LHQKGGKGLVLEKSTGFYASSEAAEQKHHQNDNKTVEINQTITQTKSERRSREATRAAIMIADKELGALKYAFRKSMKLVLGSHPVPSPFLVPLVKQFYVGWCEATIYHGCVSPTLHQSMKPIMEGDQFPDSSWYWWVSPENN
jgi:hypothetical protein